MNLTHLYGKLKKCSRRLYRLIVFDSKIYEYSSYYMKQRDTCFLFTTILPGTSEANASRSTFVLFSHGLQIPHRKAVPNRGMIWSEEMCALTLYVSAIATIK